MYWFNQKVTDWRTEGAWEGITALKLTLALTPIEKIISLLDQFGKSFVLESEAKKTLLVESGLSQIDLDQTLSIIPSLLSREALLARIRGEFDSEHVLDGFTRVQRFQGEVRAVPAGVLLHVTAGNVFLSSIDSLLTGFLTKNISILKVSSKNKFFPQYFAEALLKFDQELILADKFAVVHWKGGDQEVEAFIKKKVNTIIAWGGEEVMENYRQQLPAGVKFLDFGPKISIQVITNAGLVEKDIHKVCDQVVADIIPWDQAACSSPQNIYLEHGIDHKLFMQFLGQAFTRARERGEISEDEATEILKEFYRGLYSELMEGGAVEKGENYLLHSELNSFLRPSSLNRSLILKSFADAKELYTHLEPFSYYLQSCSYLLSAAEKKCYLELLSLTGLKRFAPLGTVTWGMDGAPHDGRFVLRELVQFIGDEIRVVNYGEEVVRVENSATLKSYFESSAHPAGYIFSSGGTTGEPKYVHFSYQEFDSTAELIARNFEAQGLKKGMMVANLFVAGNLWSSFMAVEKALEKIGVIQLPIGGLCSQDNILMYLKKFKPAVVMGIPSLIVSLAEYAQAQNEHLSVEKVFFAGEAFSDIRRDFIQKTWGTKSFGSAGYASVDAGVIGFQCLHCGPGEHHLFSDLIDLKIIEGEAVVTSLIRSTMPVVNYRTGDRVEWIEKCPCGRPDKRFKLLGRIDNVLQVWSCRLLVEDIENAFKKLAPEVLTYQIVLSDLRVHNLPKEKMTIIYEGEQLSEESLLQEIYANARDLKDTLDYEEFSENVEVRNEKIEKNSRTGKVSVVKDLRS